MKNQNNATTTKRKTAASLLAALLALTLLAGTAAADSRYDNGRFVLELTGSAAQAAPGGTVTVTLDCRALQSPESWPSIIDPPMFIVGPGVFAPGGETDFIFVPVHNLSVTNPLHREFTVRVNSGAAPGDTITVYFDSILTVVPLSYTITVVAASPGPAKGSSGNHGLPPRPEGAPATVINGPAKVYDHADTASPVLATLPSGAPVLIKDGRYGMALITYNGNTRAGWVREGNLRVD